MQLFLLFFFSFKHFCATTSLALSRWARGGEGGVVATLAPSEALDLEDLPTALAATIVVHTNTHTHA